MVEGDTDAFLTIDKRIGDGDDRSWALSRGTSIPEWIKESGDDEWKREAARGGRSDSWFGSLQRRVGEWDIRIEDRNQGQRSTRTYLHRKEYRIAFWDRILWYVG